MLFCHFCFGYFLQIWDQFKRKNIIRQNFNCNILICCLPNKGLCIVKKMVVILVQLVLLLKCSGVATYSLVKI